MMMMKMNEIKSNGARDLFKGILIDLKKYNIMIDLLHVAVTYTTQFFLR